MALVQGFNITLNEQSPLYVYNPQRDVFPEIGWNASYTASYDYVGTLGTKGTGIPYRTTRYNSASVSLEFEGTGVYFCFTPGSGDSYTLTIDGATATKTASSTDPACAGYGSTTLAFQDGLSYGQHLAILQADISNNASFNFFGGVVTVSVGVSGTIATIDSPIDDEDSRWVYSPASVWQRYSDASEPTEAPSIDGGTISSCTYASSTTASFQVTNASALWLLGPVNFNTNGYTVLFNGVLTHYGAFNFWAASQQVMFFAGGLDTSQQYDLQVQNYNSQFNPAPGWNCVNIDALVLVHGAPPSLPASSTSQSSVSSSTSSFTALTTTSAITSTTNADPATPTTNTNYSDASSYLPDSPALSTPTSSATLTPAVAGSTAAPIPMAGVIAGIAGGVVVLLLSVVALVLCLRRRGRRSGGHAQFVMDGEPDNEDTQETTAVPYFAGLPYLASQPPAPNLAHVPSGRLAPVPPSLTTSAVSVAPSSEENEPRHRDKSPAERCLPVMTTQQSSSSATVSHARPGSNPLLAVSIADLITHLNQRLQPQNRDSEAGPPSYAGA